jgi:hypothetical protein
LFRASVATRYQQPVKGDGARLWDEYDPIARDIDQTS